MQQQQPNSRPQASVNILFAAMLVGAFLMAAIATFVPGFVGLDDETALVFRCVVYAAAVAEVVLAFWLRNRIMKATTPRARGGGTIQRQ